MKSRSQLRTSKSISAAWTVLLAGCVLLLTQVPLLAQSPQPSQAATAPEQGGIIRGLVKSGNMPLPGVTVTAVNTLTGQKAVAWTDVDGTYTLQVPADGRYVVRTQLAAFAPLTHEVVINAANRDAKADLEMVLLSRAQQAAPGTLQQEIAGAMAAAAGGGRGFQSLSLNQSEGGGTDAGGGTAADLVPSGMPVPGISSESATESVSISGSTSNPMGSMSGAEFQERITEFREQAGSFGGGGGGGGGFGGGGFGGGGRALGAAAGPASSLWPEAAGASISIARMEPSITPSAIPR